MNLTLVPILNQINSPNMISCFFQIRSNILPFTPRSTKQSLVFRFPDQNVNINEKLPYQSKYFGEIPHQSDHGQSAAQILNNR
jgi:hypothetical protein